MQIANCTQVQIATLAAEVLDALDELAAQLELALLEVARGPRALVVDELFQVRERRLVGDLVPLLVQLGQLLGRVVLAVKVKDRLPMLMNPYLL